jgi:hypothetical protein
MKAIKVKKEVFLKDLETCLTVLRKLDTNIFECEYITPALEKRNVIVSTY